MAISPNLQRAGTGQNMQGVMAMWQPFIEQAVNHPMFGEGYTKSLKQLVGLEEKKKNIFLYPQSGGKPPKPQKQTQAGAPGTQPQRGPMGPQRRIPLQMGANIVGNRQVPAELHPGEAVLPANMAQELRSQPGILSQLLRSLPSVGDRPGTASVSPYGNQMGFLGNDLSSLMPLMAMLTGSNLNQQNTNLGIRQSPQLGTYGRPIHRFMQPRSGLAGLL